MESFAEIKHSIFSGGADESADSDDGREAVLVIDDNVDVIGALTCVLRGRYRVIACLSYEEATGRLTPEVKVALLDIKMAGRDGVEAFGLLKQERQDLQIIFHSAYPGSGEKATEIGQLDHGGYLIKGEYTVTELFAAIETALCQAKRLRQSFIRNSEIKERDRLW